MSNIPKKYQNLLDEFPFLTLVSYGGQEYVGIIQNIDNNLASMYNFDSIKTPENKQTFLELGEDLKQLSSNHLLYHLSSIWLGLYFESKVIT